jgi:hypothetical protein
LQAKSAKEAGAAELELITNKISDQTRGRQADVCICFDIESVGAVDRALKM